VVRELRVPAALRRKALAEGDHCLAWLNDLPCLLGEIEDLWRLRVGEPMEGGTASFVAPAATARGTTVVVKLAMPAAIDGWEALDREARFLGATAGRGCVRILAYDGERHAVLLEKLGRQLTDLGLPLHLQLGIICGVLRSLWGVQADPTLPSGADKARWLATFISDAWDLLDRPCPARVIDHAVRLAERRASAFSPDRAVLVHGDGHAWNTLEDPQGSSEFRLVDPDGLYAEPEYDLGISMREYSDELLAGDPLRRGRDRARLLAELTDTDAERIWEWGYLERVSGGLLLIKLDKDARLGRTFLKIADVWSRPQRTGC
jgi:streptomycin 6-kinase